jgi:hypothetical protein
MAINKNQQVIQVTFLRRQPIDSMVYKFLKTTVSRPEPAEVLTKLYQVAAAIKENRTPDEINFLAGEAIAWLEYQIKVISLVSKPEVATNDSTKTTTKHQQPEIKLTMSDDDDFDDDDEIIMDID